MGQQRSEKLEKIHLILCMLAASSIAVGFVIRALYAPPAEYAMLFNMALWVSLSIMIFYVLGIFVKAFLVNSVFPLPVDGIDTENVDDMNIADEQEIVFSEEVPPDMMYDEPAPVYNEAMLTAAYE